MSRRFKRVVNGALILASVFLFVTLTFPGSGARAARSDNGKMDFVVGVEGNITIMLPKTDISFMLDPSKDEVFSRGIDIAIDSNLSHGVVLGMTTAYSKTSGDDVTANGLNSVHSNTIIALNETVHRSFFPTNRWGFSTDGGNYYQRMPAANEGHMGEILIEDPSSVTTQTVYIGAKVDVSQPLDYYYTTINFTAITNLASKTIEDILYMQEVDADVVSSMETDHQYRLRDIRDGTDYWVAKLQDGNVWMTQDLALTLSPDMTLTQDDTDIKRRWTPTVAQTPVDYNLKDSYQLEYQENYMLWTITAYRGLTQVCEGGICTYQYARNLRDSIYGKDIDECLTRHQDNPKFCNHFRRGQVYTPEEATARNAITNYSNISSIDLDESICPKGWRLPSASGSYVEMPIPSNITIAQYDENGILEMSGTLSADRRYAPTFFLDEYYYTSTIQRNGNITIANGYGSDHAGTNSINSNNVNNYFPRVRCMVRQSNTFEISYDLNGGEGEAPQTQKASTWSDHYDFQLAGLSTYPEKAGYNLIGWSTNPNATHPEAISYNMDYVNYTRMPIYNENGERVTAIFTATQPHTTLYAVWENAVKLEFDANGGEFPGTLYSGETSDRIFLSYSVPVDGTIESETKHCSSPSLYGAGKTSKDDNSSPYMLRQSSDCYGNFGTYLVDYDYVDVTIYYEIPGDTILCVASDSTIHYSDCDISLSGNLGNDNTSDIATGTYQHVKNFRLKNSNNSYQIAFYGNSNKDDNGNNWFGYWADIKAVKIDGHTQYLRSSRKSITTPTRSGHKFMGWSTNPNATVADWEYSSKAEYPESLVLYAIWKEYPLINLAITTDQPEHVNIIMPTVEWNSSRIIEFHKNDSGEWQYYDADTREYHVIARPMASDDQFYQASSSISRTVLSFSDIENLNLNDGDSYTISISYSETPIDTMQALTRESCALAPVNTAQRLTDSRDNKKYWVTRLADGRCWMTQNLDLALSTSGTTLYPNTSAVTEQITIYIQSSWTSYYNDNNYYDGGDYYYADGTTPTATTGLAEDAEEWHWHRGSYYNKKLADYVCPSGWQAGDYQKLFASYDLIQKDALYFTPVGSTPLEAPFYQIIDTDSSMTKPDTDSADYRNTHTLYWSKFDYVNDILRTTNRTGAYYMYRQRTEPLSSIRAYTNANSDTYRSAGFIRCAR